MRQKVIAVISTLLLQILLLTAGLPLCFAQHRLPSAGNPDSGTSGPTLVPSSSTSSPPSEGCQLLPYNGTTPLSQVPFYVAGEEDLRGGMICTFRINSKLPPFTFHFPGQPDNTFSDLDITTGTGSEVIQTIQNATGPGDIAPMKAESVLTTVDANFDGNQDLQLLSNCGATGNCSYDFYLYDPRANEFVHNDFLSNLTTPSFDQSKKQVTTSSNSSVSDWENETYRYENDSRYTLIHREVSRWDRSNSTVTVTSYELRNGKMELVGSTTTRQ